MFDEAKDLCVPDQLCGCVYKETYYEHGEGRQDFCNHWYVAEKFVSSSILI